MLCVLGEEKCVEGLGEHASMKEHLEDIGIGGRIMLEES
jgi:hypothetical protein